LRFIYPLLFGEVSVLIYIFSQVNTLRWCGRYRHHLIDLP